MDSAGPVSMLRSVIADGLARLDEAHGGRYLAEVARYLGVERSTVSRWRHRRSTPQPDHCEVLARRWPEYFDREELLGLQFQAAQGAAMAGMAGTAGTSIGIEVLDSPAAILEAATVALAREPANAADRVYRHVAFHLDRNGGDPIEQDPMYREMAGAQMSAFRELVAQRAAQGWDIRMVVSAGNPNRYDSIAGLVGSVDGPNVEIFAYPMRLPLLLAPLVVANRDVILAHDHRRWERPGAAVMMRSIAVARWADNYVSGLAADAPFRLRDPSGADAGALARFRGALG